MRYLSELSNAIRQIPKDNQELAKARVVLMEFYMEANNPNTSLVKISSGFTSSGQNELEFTEEGCKKIFEIIGLNPNLLRIELFQNFFNTQQNKQISNPSNLTLNNNNNQNDTPSAPDIFNAIENNDLKTVEKLIKENPTVVNATNKDNYTPIMLAIKLEKIKIIPHLIDNGATIGEEIYKAEDLLFNFIRSGKITLEDKTEIIKSLITANKRLIDTPLTGIIGGDSTLLMRVCGNDELSPFVDLLIDNGADVNKKGAYGYTPLINASENACLENVMLLLSRDNILVNEKNNGGWSALALVCFYRSGDRPSDDEKEKRKMVALCLLDCPKLKLEIKHHLHGLDLAEYPRSFIDTPLNQTVSHIMANKISGSSQSAEKVYDAYKKIQQGEDLYNEEPINNKVGYSASLFTNAEGSSNSQNDNNNYL